MKTISNTSRHEPKSLDVRFTETAADSGGQIEIEFLKPLPLNRPCPPRGVRWLSRLLDRIRPAAGKCACARPDQLDLDLGRGTRPGR